MRVSLAVNGNDISNINGMSSDILVAIKNEMLLTLKKIDDELYSRAPEQAKKEIEQIQKRRSLR